MSFLENLFTRNKNKKRAEKEKSSAKNSMQEINVPAELSIIQDDYLRLGIACYAKGEEKEIVSAITSAIVAGDNPNSNFKIKQVYVIDQKKEAAMIIASAIAAENNANSNFRVTKIQEI